MDKRYLSLGLTLISMTAAAACTSSEISFGDPGDNSSSGSTSSGTGSSSGAGGSASSSTSSGSTSSGTGGSTSSGTGGSASSSSSSSTSSGTGGEGGSGGCTSPQQCPGTDTTCQFRTCEDGSCGMANAAIDTPCSEQGGKLCDGNGSCVGCIDNNDCAATANCVDNKCKPKETHGGPCKLDGDCLSARCINDSCCANSANDDQDQDGFSAANGDCNDCDAASNPGAIDIVNTNSNDQPLPDAQQVDEDCSGQPLLPAADVSCDSDPNLLIDSNDPLHAAMALDLCQTQQGDSWGLVSAHYKQIDGQSLPATSAANLGHGVLDAYGPNVSVQRGKKMLLLSTGTARRPNDYGFADLATQGNKDYTSAYPPGVPFNSQSCPAQQTGEPHDAISLQIKMRVPTNATELSFDVKFYTMEFPAWICSDYNDIFLARMTPAPASSSPLMTNNITFDSKGEPLSVNNVLLDVCTPQSAGGKMFTCSAGTSELSGTGFEGHAATSWLSTTAAVKGGETITMDFGVMDAGDGVYNSSVLIDNLRWTATQGVLIKP